MENPTAGAAGREQPVKKLILHGGVLFFGVFFFLPIGFFYFTAFTDAGGKAILESLSSILLSDEIWSILRFTAGQAALSAAASIVLAIPGAYLVSHYRFPLSRLFLSLSLIPFILPSIIVIICMISFYGVSGIVNRLLGTEFNLIYNFGGIVLAHIFYNFSLAIRIIADGRQSIDSRHIEAARSLGDGWMRTFYRITLPLLIPSIVTSFLLIFMYCFFSFGIVLVFGGVRFATFEVRIYQEMYVRLDMMRASLYSFVQIAFSGLFILFAGRIILHGRPEDRRGVLFTRKNLSDEHPVKKLLLGLYAVFLLVFLIGPLVTMIGRSFVAGGKVSFFNYLALFRPGVSARDIEGIIRSTIPEVLATSVSLAALSGTLTFALALAVALALRGRRNGKFETFFQIPLGVSLVTLSLGLRLLYADTLPFFPLVVMGQVFTAFPFVFRILKTTVDSLRYSYVEAAESLGASPFRVFTDVTVPLLERGLLNAFAYSLAIPFADLTIVLSIARGAITTFPVAIYRLIGFRSFDFALALGGIYIAVCLLLFLWIDLTSTRGSEEHAR